MMYKNISIPDELDFREDYGGNLSLKYVDFISHITRVGFTYIRAGSFRKVYMRNKIVIKVPKNGDGIIDNIVEAIAWRKYRNGPTDRHIYLTPCRLLSNYCLMMPTVIESHCLPQEETPPWIKNLTDGQWGLYRNRFTVYDFAFEVKERFQIENMLGIKSQFWNSRSYSRKKNFIREEPIWNPNE